MNTYDILLLESKSINEFATLFNQESFNITKVSTYEDLKKQLNKHTYILLVVNIEDNNYKYIEYIKQLRDENIWIPVCFYSSVPNNDILKIMDGRNCLTVFHKSESKKDILKRIKDILFLVSPEGMQQLNEIHKKLEMLKQRVQKLNIKLEVA